MRIAIAAVLLSLASPAFAEGPQKVECVDAKSSAELKADFVKAGTWTVLTPGQFHFAEGLWTGLPSAVAPGGPPGDGAAFGAVKGEKGAALIFTRHGNVCLPFVPIPANIRELFDHVVTGPLSDTGTEM